MAPFATDFLDTRSPISVLYDSPWNHYEVSIRNPAEQAELAVQAVQAVDEVLNDTVGSGRSNINADSSPRVYSSATAALCHGVAFEFSRLNEPAFNEQSIDNPGLCLHSAGSEYLGTEGEYQNAKTPSVRSCRKMRHHPYPRDIGKSGTVYTHTSHIYSQSEFGTDQETLSTYSQTDGRNIEPYHPRPSEYVYGSGSINPSQLTVSNSQSPQQYWPTYPLSKAEQSLSPLNATALLYHEQNVEVWSCSSDVGDIVPTIGNSSDEENEAVVAQSVMNCLKKGDLKKSNSGKGKKRGAKGSTKGVQKRCEGKADKGVKGRKPKDRHPCTYSPCSMIYSNASELRKHVQVKHLRPFKCTFSFAGCDQIFGSKNEWKRHVTSQHMYLSYWECNLSLCKDRHAFFNRKDLFGQHLKRMHVPQARKVENFGSEEEKKRVQEQNKVESEKWIREEIPKIQDSCFKVLRETPLESNCEICGTKFSGPKSWDTKMEHVGKHHENGEQPPPDGPLEDKGLIEWALKEGLVIERDPYESSSNTSESGYFEPFPALSPSAHKVLMENNCKYQFTKSNQFMRRSNCSDQSPIQIPDNFPLSNKDLVPQTDNICYTMANNCPSEMLDHLLFDGAFNDAPPGDHDTHLLLTGGRIIVS